MDDLERFRSLYITECFELLEDMEERLLALEDGSSDSEALNAIFRCAHSIKGGAGAFSFTAITQFTHILESLLDQLREGKIAVTRQVIDCLLQARDIVFRMVEAARDNQSLPEEFGAEIALQLQSYSTTPQATNANVSIKKVAGADMGERRIHIRFIPRKELLTNGNEPLLILRELQRLGNLQITADTSRLPAFGEIDREACYLSWDLTLETAKAMEAVREVFEFVEDDCELSIEEISKEAAEALATQSPPEIERKKEDAVRTPAQSGAATSIRVDIDKVDRLINMVGEVVITQAMLIAQSRFLPPQEFGELIRGIEEFSQHTRDLQEAVMAIRMQPVKSIFSRMPRIVRDISAQLNKDIRLEMKGETTEVDKTIIEQLSDPLMHMIRNSVDHGIETPDQRRKAGKAPQGVIVLSAEQRGGRIVIEVKDDGAGINRDKVLKKAIEKGLVDKTAELSGPEIDSLIFAPGFSTAETVSNVSGRGVGMDVVRRNIEAIGGVVAVENHPGEGSGITISLPLTLAILDGMIVRVGKEHYIIPIASIIESMRPRSGEVKRIADGSSVINVRGQFIPILYLHRIFNIHTEITHADKGLVVLVENGREQLGLVVDELVGQQQVVIKTLEENADPITGISGATILGDGKVSLILDIAGLRKDAGTRQESNKLAA